MTVNMLLSIHARLDLSDTDNLVLWAAICVAFLFLFTFAFAFLHPVVVRLLVLARMLFMAMGAMCLSCWVDWLLWVLSA